MLDSSLPNSTTPGIHLKTQFWPKTFWKFFSSNFGTISTPQKHILTSVGIMDDNLEFQGT
jgi:hypothetical protein